VEDVMAAVYANKFTLQLSDVARIVFVDEHIPVANGLPKSVSTAAEVVMTRDNLKALNDLITKMLHQDS
jgi:hypothetical protein